LIHPYKIRLKRNWKSLARPVYHRMRSLWMRGQRRHCPLCGGSFRRFLPKGNPRRIEAMCPGCLSLERQRLVWLFLTRELHLGRNPLSLLHFAPEPGMRKRLKSMPNIRYASSDLVPGRGDAAMDVTRLAIRSESFDTILCSHVLEHVCDDLAALNEIRRVLKPNGMAILQVPMRGHVTDEDASVMLAEDRLHRFGQEDHVRIYGRDFASRVREAGFEVEVMEYAKRLSPAEIERCRLTTGDDAEDWIFLARRP
jgi:SAM-dependent methyltransferase